MAVGGINVLGIFTDRQIESWQGITEAVHLAGGRIFAQPSRSYSVSHPLLLNGDATVAPSVVNPCQRVMTVSGYVDPVELRALALGEIQSIIVEYGVAAANARRVGFDGVEVHGANVYLLPEFLNTSTNQREDEYRGNSREPRQDPHRSSKCGRNILGLQSHRSQIVPSNFGHRDAHGSRTHPQMAQRLFYRISALAFLRCGFDTNGNPIEMLREHTLDHDRETRGSPSCDLPCSD